MLIDLDTDYEGKLKRLGVGQYLELSRMVNHSLFGRNSNWYNFDFEWPEAQGDKNQYLKSTMDRFKSNTWFKDFGSCDSPEQFMTTDYGKIITESPHEFVVTFQHMTAEQDGGYRWHKNGPYIGLLEPVMEHLHDEPVIKEIYQFTIRRKK